MERKERFYRVLSWVFELGKGVLVLAVAATLAHFFVATIFIVEGPSMEPNFQTGQYLLVNRIGYTTGSPHRGDAVILRFPGDPDHKKFIKRLVGLPGDHLTIKNNKVYLNNQELVEPYLAFGTPTYPGLDKTLGPDEYFLLGDNRENSNDSRIWGPAGKDDLIGKAIFSFWPLDKLEKVD